MKTEHYDMAVLGGGKAGKTLAMDFAGRGCSVALVEEKWIGGGCINVACIPSKTLVHSARLAYLARRSAAEGVRVPDFCVDMPAVLRNKQAVVASAVELNRKAFEASGLTYISGTGQFIAPREIEVRDSSGVRRITADKVFINTGTRPLIPAIAGLADAPFLTSETAMEIDRIPDHLIVLGTSYVALEFAQIFRRLGSKVSVVGRSPRMLMEEEEEFTTPLCTQLQSEGILFYLSAQISKVEESSDRVKVHLTGEAGAIELAGTDILVATGRRPVTEDLGLENAAVAVDERGFISVNERLETSAPSTWALGDVAGTPQFTHASLDDYRIVAANLRGGDRSTRTRLIPSVLFTDPELAHIGAREHDLLASGRKFQVARLPMAAVPAARTRNETNGLWKALVASDTGDILGATLLGTGVSEIISTIQIAMLAGLPYTTLRDAIFSHPTLSEGLNVLFSRF